MNYAPYLSPEVYQDVDLSLISDQKEIRMTNDYLFRAMLQENNFVLKSMVCALLHLDESKVSEVVIQNPVLLGQAIDNKDFILDVKVLVDGKQIADLEMQVVNRYNWEERSISYAGRAYDNINRGKDYLSVISVTQVGILDYTPKPDIPLFFYTASLRCDQMNDVVYSDKFRIAVLDLTKIDNLDP